MTRWLDLSRPLSPDVPGTEVQPEPSFQTVYDVREDGINVQYICAATHTGTTHIDAPMHFVPDGATVEELAVDRFVGEAVVLDVMVDEAREIRRSEIASADGEVHTGDIVFLSTGWADRYGTDDYNPWPWISVDAAEWLIECGVSMLCVDTTSPDMPRIGRPDDWWFPVHRTLLENDVLIAEHLTNVAKLSGRRFDVVALPIAIEGGDAAPSRFLADLDSVR